MRPGWGCGLYLIAAAHVLCSVAASARAAPTAWLTGAALRDRLSQPAEDIYWKDAPLRAALTRYCRAQRVALLIDRRVDPDRRISFSLGGTSLGEAFERIAKHLGLGLSLPGPLAYLGPPEAASRLWTLMELRREEARALPAAAATRFLQPDRFAWADFSTPRELLARLAAQSHIAISGLEQVPHDLWAAADLPPLAWVDRLTLIAVQFDLTFRLADDGAGVALVPLPDDVSIVRSYPAAKEPEPLASRWAALVPDSRIKVVGAKIFVKGRMEDHQRLMDAQHRMRPAARAPEARPAKAPAEKRYTIAAARGTLGGLLGQLAARFGLELRIDQEAMKQAGISLQQPVSFSAKEVTMDGLFEALLSPAGCTFRRHGTVLEVRPASP